ncbi:MAG: YjgN family protein [Burkholderiales bacterium]
MTVEFPSAAPPAPPPESFRFSGNGAEFFRIWIVNLALTVVTLGIYSAWAKVRKLQYFYRHTQLAGSSFDYHGQPMAILKGRLIAVALLGGSNALYAVHPLAGTVFWIPVAAIMPWLLVRSLAFRLHNTSWRGLRFRFDGSVTDGYRVFLLWPLAALVTLGLLWPRAHRELKRYQHNHSRFGNAPFTFDAPTRAFYRAYVRTGLLFVVLPAAAVGSVVGGLVMMNAGTPTHAAVIALVAVAGALYLCILASGPYLVTCLQNLVWNNTGLPPHRFTSALRFGPLFWIILSNLVLTLLTLGLYRPFAMVRVAQYRMSCLSMMPGEPLDRFVGERARDVEAVGEEIGEFLDIDIAL